MIKDEVRYRLPFFPLGELMFLAVRHQLNRIFDYRTTRIKEIFQEANQKKTLNSMTPVKQELVLGCFALAIAAAFISANR